MVEIRVGVLQLARATRKVAAPDLRERVVLWRWKPGFTARRNARSCAALACSSARRAAASKALQLRAASVRMRCPASTASSSLVGTGG